MKITNRLALSPLCVGLSISQIQAIANAGQERICRRGEAICRQGENGDSMFIILQGHANVTRRHANGEEIHLNSLRQGQHFGELSVLVGEPRAATVTALMDIELLQLHRAAVQKIMESSPHFASNLCHSLGTWLRGTVSQKPGRNRPTAIALVGSGTKAQVALPRVARALQQRDRRFRVLSERADGWTLAPMHDVVSVSRNGSRNGNKGLNNQFHKALNDQRRLVVDVQEDSANLLAVLDSCEEIYWFVDADDPQSSLRRLGSILDRRGDAAENVYLVWLQSQPGKSTPVHYLQVATPSFRLPVDANEGMDAPAGSRALARLTNHIQRLRVGLVLGGGGGRGSAHIGVLRVLEREGLSFDTIAGVSVGALMGLAWSHGLSLDDLLGIFENELAPGRLLRRFPAGGALHMWKMYRFGGWERRARKYFRDSKLENLPIPVLIGAADLVSGRSIMHERGDAVEAMLESINLPGLSRPIVRDGAAIIDGGLLNNLPANVLRERGADLVVGVDICSRVPQRFGRNTPATAQRRVRLPGLMQTMLRVIELQQYVPNLARADSADVVIKPDTSTGSISDFTNARQMADMGEQAATEALPQIRRLFEKVEN